MDSLLRSCCYRNGSRAKGDYGYTLSKMCYPVSLENMTKVGADHEFIAIFCSDKEGSPIGSTINCVDVQAFVPLKPEVENRPGMLKSQSKEKPNVVILGLDAVSRANFLRAMPKSYKFLMEVMGATDMESYNKVGDYTLPNLSAMLTSLPFQTLMSTCAKNNTFDACPFIWKDFSQKGYRTAFNEDNILSIFNGRMTKHRGFKHQPTDYYMRTFTHISDNYFRGRQEGSGCQGPRLFFETVLDYTKKFIYKMNKENKPFFFLAWEGSLTHEDINDSTLGDEPLRKALSWIHENKQLNNTIFILTSDHGMRMGEITRYRQGFLEDRLPLMFFVFPEWFKTKYKRAYNNLRGNSKRLTTSLDLYYTLQDILDINSISDKVLDKRERELECQFTNESNMPPPKGISHFLPVPPTRTCRHTIIEPQFCVCTHFGPVSVRLGDVSKATLFVLKDMNSKLKEFAQCKHLSLLKIKAAQWSMDPNEELTYLIDFTTNPGGGAFEVVVMKNRTSWKIIKPVFRTNQHGNQNWCLSGEEVDVREFCLCK